MDSVGIPDPSPPFNPFNLRDCSQEICSAFCPQWCSFVFPPPPPLFALDDNNDSGTFFSPLIVAVIGILASAFVLVTYYAIVSKYCRRRGEGGAGIGPGESFENDRVINETRRSGSQPGLDEALIKSISVYKYKKDEGLVEVNDCSVCLSEFQENESLRLLPKCSHAFHLACIDTWLKTNSSCPLCRCNIVTTNPPPPETTPPSVSALGYRHSGNATVLVVQDLSENVSQEAVVVEIVGDATPSNQDQGSPSPSSSEQVDSRTERREETTRSARSSISEDHQSSPCRGNLSVADILSVSHEEDEEEFEAVDPPSTAAGIGPSNGDGKETEKSRNRNGVLNSAMKISISSGIFAFARSTANCSQINFRTHSSSSPTESVLPGSTIVPPPPTSVWTDLIWLFW